MPALGTPTLLIGAVLLVCAGLGIWRGWLREAINVGTLVACWLLLHLVGGVAIDLTNRLYTMAAFTLSGGFDATDPGLALRIARSGAPVDPARPEGFYTVVLIVAAVAAYWFSSRRIGGPSRWVDQALGGLAGAIDGYVVLFLGSRLLAADGRLGTAAAAVLSQVAGALGQYLTTVVVMLIAAALAGSFGAPLRGKRARSAS
jgi:hypothetical protein